MKRVDEEERGFDCHEDHTSAKTPATHSQRRLWRHMTEIDGEVLQRPQQRRAAQTEGAQGREGSKRVARRLESRFEESTTKPDEARLCRTVYQTAPYRVGDGATDGDGTGVAGGDGRSQVGAHAKVGMPIAPAMQPLRRDAQGEGEAVDSRGVGGSKPAGIAAAADERDPILMDSDLEKDDAGQKKALLQGSKEAFVHGNRGQLSLATEERTTPSPVQQYFDVVGRTLDQVDGPHDGLHETAAALLSGFACVIHAGWDAVLDMGEQVVALERERDALRASLGETAAAEGTEDDVPAWLRDAEDLLQGLAGEDANAAARTRTSEREAKDRVESFFAKAIAEEAWQRATAEFDENVAVAAIKERAEAAADEEEARAQRRAEAKARLEAREEEERPKRQAREARAAARRATARAQALAPPSRWTAPPNTWASPSPSSPETPPSSPSAPLPPSPPLTTPCQPQLPPADLPSSQSFLPSWRCAHTSACLLQRAWRRRVRREEAATEASAAIIASDGEVARRLTVLEAEKVAMEDRTARNIATARAFRQLEAELRDQGIRIARGVGTGGRQRKRRHERRRAERVTEGLLMRELAIW